MPPSDQTDHVNNSNGGADGVLEPSPDPSTAGDESDTSSHRLTHLRIDTSEGSSPTIPPTPKLVRSSEHRQLEELVLSDNRHGLEEKLQSIAKSITKKFREVSHGDALRTVADSTDDEGRSLLDLAVEEGHFQIVEVLLEAQADPLLPKSDGSTSLHTCCKMGWENILEILLEAASNLSNRQQKQKGLEPKPSTRFFEHQGRSLEDHEGNTPLFYAIQKGHTDCIAMSLNYGANPMRRNPRTGNTMYREALNIHHNCTEAKNSWETDYQIQAQKDFKDVENEVNLAFLNLDVLNKAPPVKRARDRFAAQWATVMFLRTLPLFLVIFCVLMSAIGRTSGSSSASTVIASAFSLRNSISDRVLGQTGLTFDLVNSREQFFEFLETQLAPALSEEGGHLEATRANKLLGYAQLLQKRVLEVPCDEDEIYSSLEVQATGITNIHNCQLSVTCFPEYTSSFESTEDYGAAPANGFVWVPSTSRIGSVIPTDGFNGKFGGWYDNVQSGFILQVTPDNVNDEIERLKTGDWIDEATRLILIDFTYLNANLGIMSITRLAVEFYASGDVAPSFNIVTVPSTDRDFVNFYEVVIWIYIILMIVSEARDLWKMRWNFKPYFLEFWNYVDTANIVLFFITFAFQIALRDLRDQVRNEVIQLGPESGFFHFQQVATLAEREQSLFAFNVLLFMLKLPKAITMIPWRFRVFLRAIVSTLSDGRVVCLLACFMLFLLAFATSFHIAFGPIIEDYVRFGWTMVSLLLAANGEIDFKAVVNGQSPGYALALIVTFTLLITMVIVQMFVGILAGVYEEKLRWVKRVFQEELTLEMEVRHGVLPRPIQESVDKFLDRLPWNSGRARSKSAVRTGDSWEVDEDETITSRSKRLFDDTAVDNLILRRHADEATSRELYLETHDLAERVWDMHKDLSAHITNMNTNARFGQSVAVEERMRTVRTADSMTPIGSPTMSPLHRKVRSERTKTGDVLRTKSKPRKSSYSSMTHDSNTDDSGMWPATVADMGGSGGGGGGVSKRLMEEFADTIISKISGIEDQMKLQQLSVIHTLKRQDDRLNNMEQELDIIAQLMIPVADRQRYLEEREERRRHEEEELAEIMSLPSGARRQAMMNHYMAHAAPPPVPGTMPSTNSQVPHGWVEGMGQSRR